MSKPLTILDTQLVQSTLIACATLLVYDLLCTLDQEVTYVWASPWSLGTVLFFLNRYLPFIDTFLSLNLKFSVNTPEICLRHFTVVTWLILSGILTSEVILVLRTYALWERRRSILILLSVSSAVCFIPAIVITHLEIQSLRYVSSDLPGCRLGAASPIIIVAYILLVLSETVMAVLTAIKAYRHLQFSQSPWVVQLYQDGLLFYFYLLAISIANVLVPILAPVRPNSNEFPENLKYFLFCFVKRIFANWLATPQRVLHSVLCNRVLLLILKQRSASNMTARLPVRDARGQNYLRDPIFTSFIDDGISANLTVISPSSGTHSTLSAGTSQIPTLSQLEQIPEGYERQLSASDRKLP
ncbi:hypothetical protein B0H34DRAFT_112122 [Crassisporium funariophilum]|nr:hypothetical protein B0H34DRAFT_112122 [Crassisporium funariophilum]